MCVSFFLFGSGNPVCVCSVNVALLDLISESLASKAESHAQDVPRASVYEHLDRVARVVVTAVGRVVGPHGLIEF